MDNPHTLRPEEIRSLREATGMSQTTISRKMGWKYNKWAALEDPQRNLLLSPIEAERAMKYVKVPEGCIFATFDPDAPEAWRHGPRRPKGEAIQEKLEKIRKKAGEIAVKIGEPSMPEVGPAPQAAPAPAVATAAPAQELSQVKTLLLAHMKRIVSSPQMTDNQAGKLLHTFNQIAVIVLTAV